MITASVLAPSVRSELVDNPGFETGNFTDWVVVSPNGGPVVGPYSPHSGSFAADWGSLLDGDTISQALPTVAGNTYEFSFWVRIDPSDTRGTPYFTAHWGGNTVLDISLPASSVGWEQHVFDLTASSPTTISFEGKDPLGALQLDDVSVVEHAPIASGVPGRGSTLLMSGLASATILAYSCAKSKTSPR